MSMIIFIYGPDTYRSSKKIEEIKNKFIKEVDPSRLNLAILESGAKAQEVQNELNTTPFLAKRRLVVLKNFVLKNKNEEVGDLLLEFVAKERGVDDNIIVFYETDKPEGKEKNKLFELLAKSKFAQPFDKLSPAELLSYLNLEAKKLGAAIQPNAAQQLISVAGDDLWQLMNELQKLAAYAQGRAINAKDVELMCGQFLEDNIFQLIDAIAQKSSNRALKLTEDFFSLDQNVFYLLTMIIKQFRVLVQIKDLIENGMVSADLAAKSLKIHPFVAKKSLAQAQKFKAEELKAIYGKLVELEKQLKSSYADEKLLIEKFVASLNA